MVQSNQSMFIDVIYDEHSETVEFIHDDENMTRLFTKITIEKFYEILRLSGLPEMTPEYLANNYHRDHVAQQINIFFDTYEHMEFMRLSTTRINHVIITQLSNPN